MTGDSTKSDDQPLLPAGTLARLGDRIAAHAGLELPAWVVSARVRDRAAALGMESPDHYVAFVTAGRGAHELDILLEALRVGETRFFRNTAHIDALIHAVIPALASSARRSVNAWSAGCASGEEAYTLAMILGEQIPASRISVLATDFSGHAIATARRGDYPASALNHVPERWRERGFAPSPRGRYRVCDDVAARVTFEQHNLVHDPFPTGMDIIWCRNVLMYMARDVRRRVVDGLIASLRDDGVLFIGYSETLRDVDGLEPVRRHGTVIYRKRARDRVSVTPSRRPDTSPITPRPAQRDAPQQPGDRALILSGRYKDGARLSQQLAAALRDAGTQLTIALDGAEFLGDDAAAVVRRAQRTARSSGVDVILRAQRPGTRRWLRRHGLVDDEESGS